VPLVAEFDRHAAGPLSLTIHRRGDCFSVDGNAMTKNNVGSDGVGETSGADTFGQPASVASNRIRAI
jgi:hypothetical protein